MRSAVSAVFFLGMVPLGLMAAELQTAGHQTSNVQGTADKGQPQQRMLRRGAKWRRRRRQRNEERNNPETEPTEEPMTEPPEEEPTPADMEALLALHNEFRCLHNADDLTYSDVVATSAKAHLDVLINDCGEFYHSESDDRNGYGENLYRCWGTGETSCYSPNGAMSSLYKSEVQVETVAEYGGHATQILWKSTTEMGCAVDTCNANGFLYAYLVCQYDPAGNNLSNLATEVDLPTGTCVG